MMKPPHLRRGTGSPAECAPARNLPRRRRAVPFGCAGEPVPRPAAFCSARTTALRPGAPRRVRALRRRTARRPRAAAEDRRGDGGPQSWRCAIVASRRKRRLWRALEGGAAEHGSRSSARATPTRSCARTSVNGAVWFNGALQTVCGSLSMDLAAIDVTGLKYAEAQRLGLELFGINAAGRDRGAQRRHALLRAAHGPGRANAPDLPGRVFGRLY